MINTCSKVFSLLLSFQIYGYFDPIGFSILTDRERTSVERQVKALAGRNADKTSDSTQSVIAGNTNQVVSVNHNSISATSALGVFLLALGRHESSNSAHKRSTLTEEIRIYRSIVSKYAKINENDDTALRFWATHAERLPLLASLARRFLATPGTSVPSESAFSISNYLGRKERSRLSPENLAISVFLKDKVAR